jgi:FAD/FMN-containing dehydrogenase
MLAGGIPARSAAPSLRGGPISRAGHEDGHMRGEQPVPGTGLFEVLQRRASAAVRREVATGRAQPWLQRALAGAMSRTSWLRVPYQHLPPRCLMVMGLEGTRDDVQETLGHALELATETRVEMVGVAPGERWLRRRHAVTYRMPPFVRAGGWADTLEVSASWSVLEPLYLEARAAMLKHAVTLAHFSHGYAEGGSIYFTLAGGGADLASARATHDACVEDALAVFARLGAALSHHHGVGRMKLKPLHATLGPGARDALVQLKRAFDPHGILNPGVLGLDGGTP